MKKGFFALFLITCFVITTVPLWAVTTPTPKTTPPPTGGPTPTSTNRLQEIKERVEERLQDIKEAAVKKAFWGTLTQINNSNLLLETPGGERRVKTDENTKITLDKKTAKLADLAIGNFLIVIGTKDKNDTLTANKIMAFSKPPTPKAKRQAIFGKVSDISQVEKILVVTHVKKPGVTYQVKVTNTTVITKKVDGKIKKVDFAAIAIGDRIISVAVKDKSGNTFTAKIIHVIPGLATGLEKQTTPTPTPKVKTSPTPGPQ